MIYEHKLQKIKASFILTGNKFHL